MKNLLLLLLVCSNSFAGSFGGSNVPPGTGSTSFIRNGQPTLVSEDTGTPSNSRPLPVELSGAGLGAVNQGTPNTIGNAWPMKITDGTHTAIVTASGALDVSVLNPLPAGLNNIGSITNITGTVSLPTGASTSANQSTEITALGTINTTLGTPFQAGGSIGNTSFIATQATGTNLHVVVDSGTITTTNPSVSTTGAAVPGSATYFGANQSGNLVAPTLDGSSNLNVNVQTSVLPTGASTSALQTTGNTSLGSILANQTNGTQTTQVSNFPASQTVNGTVTVTQATGTNLHAVIDSSALPTGAATSALQTTGNSSLSSIDGKLNSLGQKTMANSMPVAIASDQSSIPVTLGANQSVNVAQINGATPLMGNGVTGTGSQRVTIASDNTAFTVNAAESGTWNITNISGAVSLPTGASTAAKQPALGTAGTASADVITVQGIASMTALKVDGSAVTQPVSIAAAVQTKSPLNTTASGSSAGATVSTVTTLTAPANTVGFILMNLDTSTANIRWAIGRTASTTLGQQLQPGRDTGVIPFNGNISIIAESGTQNYDVQFISQ